MTRQEVEDIDDGRYGIRWDTTVAVYACVACFEETIWRYVFSPDIDDNFGERRIYPTHRDNSSLPERVQTLYTEARKAKYIGPGYYAVGIRRMLEAVCKDQGATGKDLFHKLDDLVKRELIPRPLAELAHQLREYGKLGAHDEAIDVTEDEVPAMEDLAEAILEYLYRAPATLAAVKTSLAGRLAQASSGDAES